MYDPSFFSNVSAALQTDRLREVDAAREVRYALSEAQKPDLERRARLAGFNPLERLVRRPSTG